MALDEFNLLEGAMPLLDLPDKELTAAELLALKPILDHILNSMVSGNERDYNIFMDWIAFVAQKLDQKISYMPFFVGDENTGKGVILSKLLLPRFGKCGLHCTNFDSITCKFNAAMKFKSLVFVDEGEQSLQFVMMLVQKISNMTHMLLCDTSIFLWKIVLAITLANNSHDLISNHTSLSGSCMSANCLLLAIDSHPCSKATTICCCSCETSVVGQFLFSIFWLLVTILRLAQCCSMDCCQCDPPHSHLAHPQLSIYAKDNTWVHCAAGLTRSCSCCT